MTIDGYGLFAFVERLIATALALSFLMRARYHEPEEAFDYRRRAVFAYSMHVMLLGALTLSALNLALPGTDLFISRLAISLGVGYSLLGYALLHLGWPGPRRTR